MSHIFSRCETFYRDTRYALRSLRRQPVFALTAVAVLGICIAANTTIFSLLDVVLLRDLPYYQPSSLISISQSTEGTSATSLPYPLIRAFQEHSRTLRSVAGYYQNTGISRVTLTGHAEPETTRAGFVSGEFFPVLGVAPLHGRWLTPEEVAGHSRATVISYGLSMRRFASPQAALGKTVEVDGSAFTVIGVMPETFAFPDRITGLWLPLTAHMMWRDDTASQSHYWWIAVGRLRPGVTTAVAEAELNRIAAQSRLAARVDRVRTSPLDRSVSPARQLALWALAGAVGAIFLIACSNLAMLLLSRGEARRQEFAVRAAIGADRSRLLQQLLTESLVIAALGGLAAVFFSQWALRAAQLLAPRDIPRLDQAAIDSRALAFLMACAAAAALLFGIGPAVRSMKSLHSSSRGVSETRSSNRWRSVLVGTQFALALPLLISASLFLRSFAAVRGVETGFRREGALVLRARLPLASKDRASAYTEEVLNRLNRIPGVAAAGAVNDLFELNAQRLATVRAIDGRGDVPAPAPLKWTSASSDFFRAMGATLLAGRYFDRQDTATSPRVVIVDESFARHFFPGQNALGRRVKGQDKRGVNDEWLTIIGIIRDMRREGLDREPASHVFECDKQSGQEMPDLLIRTAGSPLAMASTIRSAIRQADPSAIVSPATTLEFELDQQLEARRFQTTLLSVFAGVALLLASLGIFGVLHYAVSRRSHEIGVRISLGATPSQIALRFLKQGVVLALTGGAAGLFLAYITSRALSGLLFGVSSADPVTYAAVVITLSMATIAASLLPAVRAARVDPLTALREE